MSQVNEFNAYALNDNFQIVVESTQQCVGTEHNQTEAEALAKWLTYNRGSRHIVVRNSRDVVRHAKAIRRDVVRHQLREEAFAEMGVI